MVIRHKKSEAEAIKEVERLNKMGKHDYYAQGGGVDDEQITLVNGNGKKYSVGMPKIYIAERYINEVALSHILENTGLEFKKSVNGYVYEAQPTSSNQIVALLLTYNYKTRYFNNSSNKNTLYLYFNHERMEEGGMMARGGKLGSKAKYIPNRMVTEVSVERNGRETIIDGADILDGFYAKKGVKFANGGSPESDMDDDGVTRGFFDDEPYTYAGGGGVKKRIVVVLDEGYGKVINDLFNQWNNVKTKSQYDKWVSKVRETKFGTYGTIPFEEVLKNFNFDNAPINSYHLKTFKSELKSALNKYAQGGTPEMDMDDDGVTRGFFDDEPYTYGNGGKLRPIY
jgi:hypothetical protein